MFHSGQTAFAIATFLATRGATIIPAGVRAYEAAEMAAAELARSCGVRVRLPRSTRSILPTRYHRLNRAAQLADAGMLTEWRAVA